MHRALLVSELLKMIFSYLQELDHRTLASNPKQSLARCARTCKAWKEPALALIWGSLDSLSLLMRLFPPSAFSKGRSGLWRFTRSLRPRDWDLFQKYSPLVRSLAFKEGKDVDTSAFIALAIQRPAVYCTSPFLPNLHTLKWTANTSNALTCCLTFVSPSLKSLTVNAVGPEVPTAERSDATGGFLCNVAQIAPRLKQIHLIVDRLWAVSDIVNPLNTLQHLETLTLDTGSIGPFIIRGLSAHNSLTKLEIDLCGIDETFLPQLAAHRPRPGEFPTLKELQISADIYVVDIVLGMVLRTELDRLGISTFGLILAEQLHSVLATIAEVSPSLRALNITTSFGVNAETHCRMLDEHWQFFSVRSSSIEPMLELHELEELSFDLGYPVLLDDGEVEELVCSLKRLKVLRLSSTPEWLPAELKPRATLSCLDSIRRFARSLESVGVIFDATVVPPLLELQKEDDHSSSGFSTPPLTPDTSLHASQESRSSTQSNAAQTKLQTLSVGASPILQDETHHERVADYLKTVFPSLALVEPALASRDEEEEIMVSANSWNRVSALLRSQGRVIQKPLLEDDDDDIEESAVSDDERFDMSVVDEAEDYEWRLVSME